MRIENEANSRGHLQDTNFSSEAPPPTAPWGVLRDISRQTDEEPQHLALKKDLSHECHNEQMSFSYSCHELYSCLDYEVSKATT